MSKSPQFDINWSAKQFKLTYAKVMSKITVCVCLNDSERTESMWIDLCDIVPDSPALITEVNSIVVTLVQNNPFLHVV